MGNVVYLADRGAWRKWLEQNFEHEDEVWLVFPKKSSGKPRLPYNDAVEEALCFGWIDSVQRPYDEESTIQRFSKRSKRSSYSQPNRERLKWLDSRSLLHPAVRQQVSEMLKEEFVFAKDIIGEIRKDRLAWKNFQNFSEAYQRIRVAYIDAARSRPEEFQKRLRNFIEKTRAGKMFGHGGIEKHY